MVKICRVIRIKLYYRYLIEKVTSTDITTTNILQSLPHKMAENSWYEEITSLSPYVYVYLCVQLYRKFEQSRRYQQVMAVAAGVLSSIIVAPLLSLLSVGMSSPCAVCRYDLTVGQQLHRCDP